MSEERFISFLGLVVFLGVGFLLSSNRKAIHWRTILGALGLQAAFAGIVLAWDQGRQGLAWISGVVQDIITAGFSGVAFLFGELVTTFDQGFIFAFRVLPVIIFISALTSVLYYIGVMQWVVRLLGGGLKWLLGTSRTESLSAAANVFVGQTEAPLVIRPYLPTLSRTELFAVMVGGLASVAGSVLAGYAMLGVRMDYLIAASFMAAPGGLLFAKLLEPREEEAAEFSEKEALLEETEADRPTNVFEAAAEGAREGLSLALNVGAMLLAFIALIAVANLGLGWLGSLFGQEGWSLQGLLGQVFAPVAWLLGVPWTETASAGSFIGQKIVLNEFVAFTSFGESMSGLSPRTQAIVTFALCGFANLSSIAILLGGLGTLVPSRRSEIAALGLRAVLAATLANFTSACLVGIFLP